MNFLSLVTIAILLTSPFQGWLFSPQTITTQNLPAQTNTTPLSSCQNGASFKLGSYLVYNNQWNFKVIQPGKTYKQCVITNSSINPINASWTWSWPMENGQVKAYPEIIYGWARTPGSTNPYLPVQLSKMGSFVADFSTKVSAPGASYNTSFDIWITHSNPPTLDNRTHEVMIWVDKQNIKGWLPAKPVLGRHKIDGQEYDIYKSIGRSWTLITFVKVVPMPIGSISIDHFLNYLLENGHIPAEEYLANIEFGNEIVAGSGKTTIQSYSITTSK